MAIILLEFHDLVLGPLSLSSLMVTGLVSYFCYNKLAHSWWLKTTHVYLTVLETVLQNRLNGLKLKVSEGRCSFLGTQDENVFLPFPASRAAPIPCFKYQ